MADDLAVLMTRLGEQAVAAAQVLASAPDAMRTAALIASADAIRTRCAKILAANAQDLTENSALTGPMTERLRLTEQRVTQMASALEAIAALPDPLGKTGPQWIRPNGLVIEQRRVPIGVIGIVYESRPNVTADAGGLCVKAGNAVILRGGSESRHSNQMIHACLAEGLTRSGLPVACIQIVPVQDRAAVGYLLANMREYLDLVVPRGGRSLVARVQEEARVPVLGHLEGNCHVYVDAGADLEMARRIVLNAKMRRTGVCGAAETLLVDRACADTHLAPIVGALLEAGCEVRGDAIVQGVDSRVRPAQEADWATEYLDAVIAVRVLEGVDAAIEHIGRYGSGHTEAIVTGDAATAERFLRRVDSAIVLHNASTQFADGAEFGMGAEIGISTSRIHARGPVGAEQLTSYKYVVRGAGQVRP
jgi:glutamate-5-semialdehyde dehydrogenase